MPLKTAKMYDAKMIMLRSGCTQRCSTSYASRLQYAIRTHIIKSDF